MEPSQARTKGGVVSASPIVALQERLLSKRLITDSGCWEWTGYRMPYGYGQVGHDYKVVTTHRAAYMAFVGPIDDGLFVCHQCDNPPCFNPEHLFLGTASDNAGDMKRKGRARGAVGLSNKNAKLSDEQVRQIIALQQLGELSQTQIAEQFSITPQYVGQLAKKLWRKNV